MRLDVGDLSMEYRDARGKQYYLCRRCKNRDFKLNIYCPKCGQQNSYRMKANSRKNRGELRH